MSFDRHVAVHGERTDVAEQVIKVRDRYPDGKLVVLSAREPDEAWEPTEWFRGSDITSLCERFRRHRHGHKQFAGHWVVVVDLGDRVPVSPAYNKLFKTKSVTVVAVSTDKSVLHEHRFGTRLGLNAPAYIAIDEPEQPASSGWFSWLW